MPETFKDYPPLPEHVTAEVLKTLSVKELLVIIGRFGALQIAQRIGFDDFHKFLQKL